MFQLYNAWIQDLIAQNRIYINIIEELETESRKRLLILSNKLNEDTMKFTGDAKYRNLEHDIKELIKLIRYSERTNKWSPDNFEFKTITNDDIFGQRKNQFEISLDISQIDDL